MGLDFLIPLELLKPGQQAEILDVAGDPAWIARLAELGLRTGAYLQLLQAGPPCLVLVGGSRLSLRGDDSVQVLVRPVSDRYR